MNEYRKKCEVCNAPFASRYKHSKYCEEHRKKEKPLGTPPEEAYKCALCRKILKACEIGLDSLLAQLKESPGRLKEEIDLSRRRYTTPVPEPDGYEDYIEGLATKMDISRGLFREDLFSIKSLSEDSELSESTIKRHVHQHLIPSRYLKKVGRGFTVDIGLEYPLPHIHAYIDDKKVRWYDNVGYYGFERDDVKSYEGELDRIHDDLKLILEQVTIVWLKTQLNSLKRTLAEALSGGEITIEEKAVKLHGIRMALRPCVRTVLSELAPTLSDSGGDLSVLEEAIETVENIAFGDDEKMMEVAQIEESLQDPRNPLLRRRWVATAINDMANGIRYFLSLEPPIILIDRPKGPRSVTIDRST
ncbi:MAG: hypothetical protein E3J35_10015 [Methanomassiliicoccales archaeon]|nr:MAG: hypothetical protein E3J35_10015 [Methanomassiliicoccales archaeon]